MARGLGETVAVALVQKSAAAATWVAGATTVTPTLPAGSTSGNTLVGMLVTDTGDTLGTPAGWSTNGTSIGAIRWLPNCGSGITSQAFTVGISGTGVAALFEFSGVNAASADLKEVLTASSGTSWSVTTAANMTENNELILVCWKESYLSATKDTFTATTSGIVQDFAWNQATKTTGHASFEHKLDSGTSLGSTLTVTETMTTGTGATRAGCIITFKQPGQKRNPAIHLVDPAIV